MAIIPLPPRFSFSEVSSFRLVRSSSELRSKYQGWRQLIVFPFAVWYLEATLTEVDTADAARLRSFLAQLRGKQNKFRLPVPGYFGPRSGYAGTNCLANGATTSRTNTINLDGLQNNKQVFLDGDYFTVNDELKMVIGDWSSTATGLINGLTFEPALRNPVTDNTVITVQNPTLYLCAQNDDVLNLGMKPPFRTNGKIKLIEAIELLGS